MEYQKKNQLHNKTIQPSRFRKKKLVISIKIDMKYMTRNIKFNTAMLKQSLFNYSNAYILVK